jgi:hypothetical protein
VKTIKATIHCKAFSVNRLMPHIYAFVHILRLSSKQNTENQRGRNCMGSCTQIPSSNSVGYTVACCFVVP